MMILLAVIYPDSTEKMKGITATLHMICAIV